MHGIVARGVKLEGFANERSFGRVNDDGTLVPVVEIAHGRLARPNTVPELLPDAAFDVLGEVINVVFALAKSDIEHEFSVRRRLETEGRKAQITDFPRVREIDDAPAVHAVACETVRMPREDALGFALLDLREHEVELRPAGSLGRPALLERLNYG